MNKELQLTSDGKQPITIMTFGSNEKQPQVCEFVPIGLTLNDGKSKNLTLYSAPLICEPLTCQPISICQENFEHLANLILADSSDDNCLLEIDILIGSDHYLDIVTSEVRRGQIGPVAIHTESFELTDSFDKTQKNN